MSVYKYTNTCTLLSGALPSLILVCGDHLSTQSLYKFVGCSNHVLCLDLKVGLNSIVNILSKRYYTVFILQGRRDAAAAIMKSIGPQAVLIPSGDHRDVMAGQGTISLEMLEQVCITSNAKYSISAGHWSFSNQFSMMSA